MNKIDPLAARSLIVFVSNYVDLLEKSLEGVHSEMRETVDGVMRGINEISNRTTQKRPAAVEPSAAGERVAQDETDRAAALEYDLQALLLNMMGALSRDDIITQRLHHVVIGLNAIRTSLTYMLTDYEARCRPAEVERLTDELKSYVFRSYTMEEEKALFYAVFPQDRKPKKTG